MTISESMPDLFFLRSRSPASLCVHRTGADQKEDTDVHLTLVNGGRASGIAQGNLYLPYNIA